jgi:hypothetical protein
MTPDIAKRIYDSTFRADPIALILAWRQRENEPSVRDARHGLYGDADAATALVLV